MYTELLAQRVLRDERLELARDLGVAPQREVGLDAALERHEPELLEAGDLGLGERLVGEVRERGSPPQRKPFPQKGGGALRVAAGKSAAALLHERLEPVQVEVAVLQLDDVAWIARRDRSAAERLAKVGDVALQDVRRCLGRVVAPELVDQPVAGDNLAGMREQNGEHGALARAAERNRLAAHPRLERAEDPELQAFTGFRGRDATSQMVDR